MLFRHIDVLRADGTLLPAVFVGVRDKRIVYIGKEEPAGNWGETVDGAAYLMIPGLVNSHTHVAMTLMRGYGDDMPLDRWLNDRIFPFEDKLTGEDRAEPRLCCESGQCGFRKGLRLPPECQRRDRGGSGL